MCRFILCLALGLSLRCAAASDPFDAARDAQLRGELDVALERYTAAIDAPGASGADRARARLHRATVHLARSAYESARDDLSDALAIDPEIADGYFYRGVALYNLGAFTASAEDFANAARRSSGSPYPLLWRFLARAHAGQPARAELEQALAHARPEQWPGPLLAWYADAGSLQEVVAAARDEHLGRQVEKTCEAAFYVAEKMMLDERRDEAEGWLATAAATCAPTRVELASARTAILAGRGATVSAAASPPADASAGAGGQAAAAARSGGDDSASARVPAPAPAPVPAAEALERASASARGSRRHVARENVNYRQGPGLSHDRLGVLEAGAEVDVLDTVGGWHRIRLDDGVEAFVHASLLLPVAPKADALEPAEARSYVTTARLNVRAGPGLEYPRVSSVEEGTPVTARAVSGDWVDVELAGVERAFLHTDYLRPTSSDSPLSAADPGAVAPARVVTTARVHVRAGPGTDHERIGLLEPGAELAVDGSAGPWYRLHTADGVEAFVHGDFVKPAGGHP